MLVIDENDLKLLKMKEAYLEITSEDAKAIDGFKKVLNEYTDIIKTIDKEYYQSFIKKIKNIKYHGLPLEEQLNKFTEIEEAYDEYNEFQCKYKNIYEKFSRSKLTLSPIEMINIEEVRKKINSISGYLMLQNRLEENKLTVEKLSQELIDEEKKSDAVRGRFIGLEEELKDNVFNAEGRIYNSHNEIQYTNIVSELKDNDVDIRKLIVDNDTLKNKIKEAKEQEIAANEKRAAAEICYNNMPNINTRQLFSTSTHDAVMAQYRKILLEIVENISKSYADYASLKKKRETLASLIRDRVSCLTKLGYRIVMDAFDRIKLNEQIEIVNKLGDSDIVIGDIRSKINAMVEQDEEMTAASNELLLNINEDIPLLDDDKSMSQMVIDSKVFVDYISNDDIIVDDLSNRVIKVRDVPSKFKLSRAKQKTKGVIHRVNEIFSIGVDAVAQQEADMDTHSVDETFESENTKVDNSLFSDEQPFLDTKLFDDRKDDTFVNQKDEKRGNEQDVKMPDLTEKESVDNGGGGKVSELASFDEQIAALMGQNNQDSKLADKIKIRRVA